MEGIPQVKTKYELEEERKNSHIHPPLKKTPPPAKDLEDRLTRIGMLEGLMEYVEKLLDSSTENV